MDCRFRRAIWEKQFWLGNALGPFVTISILLGIFYTDCTDFDPPGHPSRCHGPCAPSPSSAGLLGRHVFCLSDFLKSFLLRGYTAGYADASEIGFWGPGPRIALFLRLRA